ncbi:MAG: FKBP-type peptidyl-prolyl cis-trans isomerase [Candidatus Nanopelagicales bacterium]
MNPRTARPIRVLALAGASLLLLAGCWTSSDTEATGAPGTTAATVAPEQSAPPVTAPEPTCPAGSADADSYECAAVTVTGAKDAEPTIELGGDFAPATELGVADIYVGSGDPVAPGSTLTVNYVGVGQQSGEVFDSSWPRGEPATFMLEQVIPGWQQGMLGMTPGGRRLLIIPGSLGYGPNGNPPAIGPDETLVFVVDLIAATPAA